MGRALRNGHAIAHSSHLLRLPGARTSMPRVDGMPQLCERADAIDWVNRHADVTDNRELQPAPHARAIGAVMAAEFTTQARFFERDDVELQGQPWQRQQRNRPQQTQLQT
ncbi:hypothetical protein CFBP498_44560 [Xanthomonas hortorum pv. vitians]|uniref:Uncharacterized protein n=1 Tax=Xanthomonas hortorum pv. vitians TaxID=83224 RepID=A0A6V7FA03_9XANT|nr:hypothetical protein CFBP498_44560 [Xanthomonas hortorum pv. vitians]CAD0360435.1 hypothetical protein CFBP498_44560 [Xanthomonas hortorum pv. vitians]